MSWLLEFRPEVAQDVAEAAKWYESRETDLGGEFVEELIQVWERILENPFIGSRRHSKMDIRWRYPERFPYRVVYKVDEVNQFILVIAVIHAARQEKGWQARV
jgi:plasmid stabilization system protein ParE